MKHDPLQPPQPNQRRPGRIALIGNFLPRLCGIATYTTHVHHALRDHCPSTAVDVYAMVDPGGAYRFPPAVVGTIEQDDLDGYGKAAAMIEASGADLIWVQHEFGIYGGPAGRYLLDLLAQVSAPLAVTFHTVLGAPTPDQRQVVDWLVARASVLIVMAEQARAILVATYGVPADKIAVIPHGVPARPYEEPSAARHRLGVEDRKTIMTFGLISPSKGIETMIRALPTITARCPEAVYWIVGATHPQLIAHDGEAYREMLETLARELGVEASLRWENRFLDEDDLLDRLATADVYVTPYPGAGQVTSGTLAYAAGSGKAIVATPYLHATELLADGRGVLVGFNLVEPMADAVASLLVDGERRRQIAGDIYAFARTMTWERMIGRIIARFGQILPQMDGQPA
jgi:glycosyltransferase involved in cell wall biosynthesis